MFLGFAQPDDKSSLLNEEEFEKAETSNEPFSQV